MTTAFAQFLSRIKKTTAVHIWDITYLFILIILVEILSIAIQLDRGLRNSVKSSELPPTVFSETISEYPILLNSYEPLLTAKSAILLDNTSKRILFSKNPNLRFSMASTTKIMTALVALEHFAFNDILIVNEPFREGSTIGFQDGEEVYFDDLMYALLLPSGNDAAYTMARNYPGGAQAFVKRMNQKASEFRLTHTHFADPAGLDDDQNYTTALDLARFASLALQNPTISRVVSTQRKVFTDVSGVHTYDVTNLNKLLGSQGVIGMKTGTTEGAGEVLITVVRNEQNEYIIVVMKSEDRFVDTQNILNLLQNNVEYLSPGELERR